MRLLVTTPTDVIADVDSVSHVRAEDATGAFGILPGHADFITKLTISVITWRSGSGGEHHIAVRGGVLVTRGGDVVEIATREATGEDSLGDLDTSILEYFRAAAAEEDQARSSSQRLHVATIRQIQRVLEAARNPIGQQGEVPRFDRSGGRRDRASGGRG